MSWVACRPYFGLIGHRFGLAFPGSDSCLESCSIQPSDDRPRLHQQHLCLSARRRKGEQSRPRLLQKPLECNPGCVVRLSSGSVHLYTLSSLRPDRNWRPGRTGYLLDFRAVKRLVLIDIHQHFLEPACMLQRLERQVWETARSPRS